MATLTKEEIEKRVNEIKPMITMSGGSTLEIVKLDGNKLDLKLVVPSTVGTFKVQGKTYGPKEITADLKKKVENHLKAGLKGITVKFSD